MATMLSDVTVSEPARVLSAPALQPSDTLITGPAVPDAHHDEQAVTA